MILKIASHAQCKHTRRIQNRNDPHNPAKGTPIQGDLTPTEIAHKARRKARRVEILKTRNPDSINSNQAALLGWI
jgi:hypothetical protein